MNKNEFLQELASVLGRNQKIMENMILEDIPEWDSLGIMNVVTMYENLFNKSLSIDELSQCKTIQDLMNLAGVNE